MTTRQPEHPPIQETAEDVAARLSDEINFEQPQPNAKVVAPEFDTTTESFPPTIPEVIDSPDTAAQAADAISAMGISELKAELKAQIMDELKDDQVKRMELEKERRERETLEQQEYIKRMKASPDPWVDIVGWVRDSQGVRTELEWNVAFVDYLRGEGVTGVDDDAVVQKWVALMMHDMAGRMDEERDEESEFAG